MKRKFLNDISVNTLQVVINQLCGLGIFYVLSISLGKNDFGEINWSLAVLLTSFGILACGVDQVFVRRIASGHDEKKLLSVYLSHVLLTGFSFYSLLAIGRLFFPSFFEVHHTLLILGIAKLMIFFSTPFKQLALGLEKFRALMWMSVISNLLRSISLIILALFNRLSLDIIILVFVLGDLAEGLFAILITKKIVKVPVHIEWDKSGYLRLLKESMPQLGVAVFTSVISRYDWIFLGLFTSAVILADYSFAYKVFEMSTMPLLVIAPVLIPRFTRLFHPEQDRPANDRISDLMILLRMEMIIASLTALVMNILWVPVIDFFTHGKYGAVNRYTILILSASLPFLYLNNFLWTINFAKGRLKMIFYVFALTFAINVVADSTLIPFYLGEGAALGYLLAMLAQSIAYLYHTRIAGLYSTCAAALIAPASALAAALAASALFSNTWMAMGGSVFLYGLLLIITRQLKKEDWLVFKRISGH